MPFIIFMISPCPPYYSSALSCLLRSHHVLLFRLVASDCRSCSAKLGRSVLSSSLALSFSMPLASCLHLLSCYSARILSAFLCHEAAKFYLILRSSVAAVTPGHPNQSLCAVCVGVQRREHMQTHAHIPKHRIARGASIFQQKVCCCFWKHYPNESALKGEHFSAIVRKMCSAKSLVRFKLQVSIFIRVHTHRLNKESVREKRDCSVIRFVHAHALKQMWLIQAVVVHVIATIYQGKDDCYHQK